MKKLKKPSKLKKDLSSDDPLDGDMSDFMRKNMKNFRRVRFEFAPKDKSVTIRMSEQLLNAIKKKAEVAGLDYQKYIRIKLEHSILDDAA
jgi:predicted DNA binding CopG/RHH family protein